MSPNTQDRLLVQVLAEIRGLKNRVQSLEALEYVARSGVSNSVLAGCVYVPLVSSLTHVDWDGDAKSVGSYTLTPAMFGYPTAARAVQVFLGARWPSVSDAMVFYAQNPTSGGVALCRSSVAGIWMDGGGIVACDEQGRFVVIVAGSNTAGTIVEVAGYFV